MSTILITGANRGIGLAMARHLTDRGDTVIAACRHRSPELDALNLRVEPLDVSDAASVDALAGRLSDVQLDVLVHSAGVLDRVTLDGLDLDRIRRQLEVNALGPLAVTAALRPSLNRGSKVAILTSRMGSIGDNTSGSHYGYRMSKAAVNAAGVSLAHDLAPDGIAVVLLHPGYVRTDMTGGRGDWDAPEAAAALIDRIDALDVASTGRFLHARGQELPW